MKQPQCKYIQNLNSNWIYYDKRTTLIYKFKFIPWDID